MNGPFQVAQATGTGTSNATSSAAPRIYKLTKPLTDQAVIVNVGYDQKVQVDFSSIANEKITLVHVGEKLIILFDNQSTVTVEPFFDSRNDPRQNITIEMGPGRDISVSEFASLFPISNDASVLPAAGGTGNGNAQASGGDFRSPSVEPLSIGNPLDLLGNEDLGTFTPQFPTGTTAPETPAPPAPPTITAGLVPGLFVDESFLTVASNGIAGSGQAPAGSTVATGLVPFTIDAPAGQQSLAFALSINNPTTNLIDSATGQVVTLVQKGSGEVDGVVTSNGVQTSVFTLTDNGAGQLTLTDLRAVHENTPGNPNEGITLLAGLVSLTATVTDVNNNTASATVDVGSHLTFLDDGPISGAATVAADTLVLDESAVGTDTAGGVAPVGLATVTANFADNFTGGSYGADGAGTTAFTLKLTGSNVASGLFALDAADKTAGDGDGIGQGAQIVLNQAGNVITGSAGGTTYFTITIDPATGIVTFAETKNIWHPDANNSDDAATLTTAAGLLQLVKTITDADGDSVATTLDLGNGVFSIQDDGPAQGRVLDVQKDTLVLDESAVGTDTVGGIAPVGLASVTADYSNNFSPVNYGTDGAGTTTYKFELSAANVGSGLYALDAADKTAGDGDGIGQGSQILLSQTPDGVIHGMVGAVEYFTISVDGSGIVTFTQVKNIWHADPNNSDDAATLTTALAGDLKLTQTVTDADGDHT
ncbi:MAG: DUF5801 repeats-in-toxin domain-containing protein, partial [Bradyrhizobium sp.]